MLCIGTPANVALLNPAMCETSIIAGVTFTAQNAQPRLCHRIYTAWASTASEAYLPDSACSPAAR